MGKIVYRIVQHDGGWTYEVNGTLTETYRTREAARVAARRAASEQSSRYGEQSTSIEYEDEHGKWHRELSEREDRPDTEVKD
jgi:hypothetical protein